MEKVDRLYEALEAAEKALGHAVERYRIALGCCNVCGEFFEPGDVGIAMVDEKSRIGFEHETCPKDPIDYGSSYRNDQQTDL